MSKSLTDDLGFAEPGTVAREQVRRLQAHVRHCMEASPYYRRVLQTPPDFSPDDLTGLPVTTKAQLAAHNDDFLAVPTRLVADIVQTSGTGGEPTRVAYSDADLERLGRCEELAMSAAGVTADDTALLTCTLDRCFVAGLAYYLGLRAIGAAVVRTGHMPIASLAEMVERLHPTVLVGVPGFLRKLALSLRSHGRDVASLGVRRLILIGDPLRDAAWQPLPVTRELESLWGATAHSTYATTETVTACCECTQRHGGHVLPAFGIFEILDEQDRPLPPGQPGEVTITPLGIEAMPLLRFKTGDISFLETTPCACGRTAPRLGPIIGRKAQMIKFKGTTLYPPAVFAAMDECPRVEEYCLDILSDEVGHDRLRLHVSLAGPTGSHPAALDEIRETLQGRLRVVPELVVEPSDTLRAKVFPPESRKAIRCRDLRTDRAPKLY